MTDSRLTERVSSRDALRLIGLGSGAALIAACSAPAAAPTAAAAAGKG